MKNMNPTYTIFFFGGVDAVSNKSKQLMYNELKEIIWSKDSVKLTECRSI